MYKSNILKGLVILYWDYKFILFILRNGPIEDIEEWKCFFMSKEFLGIFLILLRFHMQ